jgi:cation diffusion facilitator family transporter
MIKHGSTNASSWNIGFAFYLKVVFVFAEIVGFFFTNSMAVLSNAFHDGGDCLSLALAYFLEKKSTKPQDDKYSFGYARFSLLSSVVLALILIISSVIIIIEAVRRFFVFATVKPEGMLWLSIVGVFINLFVALKLNKGKSLNEKVVFIHIMKDLLSWIGVGIVSCLMMFYNVPLADTMLSILVSLWVLLNVQKQLRESTKVFLQAVPKEIDMPLLRKQILSIEGVQKIEKLNVWSLNGRQNIMSVILLVRYSDNKEDEIKQQIRNIANSINVKNITIEINVNYD